MSRNTAPVRIPGETRKQFTRRLALWVWETIPDDTEFDLWDMPEIEPGYRVELRKYLNRNPAERGRFLVSVRGSRKWLFTTDPEQQRIDLTWFNGQSLGRLTTQRAKWLYRCSQPDATEKDHEELYKVQGVIRQLRSLPVHTP